MALRAVVFDYGMVLSGPPDPRAHNELVRRVGLPAAEFDALYWADRHAFDEGKLTGEEFWRNLLQKAGVAALPALVAELLAWDARMWMTLNPAMLAWQGLLQARGLRTAVLSNLGDATQQAMERELPWLKRFDALVWSYQERIAKPDPAIYRITLDRLGARPDETLFLDDRPENVAAAAALGIQALVFTTADALGAQLVARGLDKQLPLPDAPRHAQPSASLLHSPAPEICAFLAAMRAQPAGDKQ